MTYQEQLHTEEWQRRRREIIKRDGHRCTCCGRGSTFFKFRMDEEKILYIGFDYSQAPIVLHEASSIKSFSVDDYKKERGILQIYVFKDFFERKREEISVALADGKTPILVSVSVHDLNRLHDTPGAIRHHFEVREYSFADGSVWAVLTRKTSNLEGLTLLRPYVSEWPVDLHVHHKYYVISSLAWEYPEDALITVCHECHASIHLQGQVPVYIEGPHLNDGVQANVIFCERCGGMGYIMKYKHIQDGICFSCMGERYFMNGEEVDINFK